MSDRLLSDLDPTLQPLAQQWQTQCKSAGLNAVIIVTWRDPADQNTAKEEGLSNASAGQSPHNCCDADGKPASRAFDFGIFEDNGQYVEDGTDPRYKQAAQIGKNLGLVWGGDFKSIFDPDHLELAGWQTL